MTGRFRYITALWLVLSLAVLLAAVAQQPFPSLAAGGSIRVVEARQEVNYPSGVGLSVTVESEADIAEVRVYYRSVGSRKWGYAYADFRPGKQVVATQSIPVRESTYIAPGADVEYFYEIKDVEGNIFRTEHATVEYLDQRFNWRRVNIGPLELLYHDIDDSRVEDAARRLREDLRRVEELLQMERPAGFKGVIYNRYDDANAAFPVQSRTTTDHGTFAGYAFPEQGVFLGNGLDRRIIVHESAHMMLHDALGNRALDLPDWLNEGFATYMEPNVRVRSSSELYRRTPHLRAMSSLSGTPETIPLFYQKSVSVVAHLIEEYGEDNFRRLLDGIASGQTLEATLVNVYGFDDHGLDASWAGLPIPEPVQNLQPQHHPEPTAIADRPDSGLNSGASAERREEEAVASTVRSSPDAQAPPQPRRENSPLAQSTPAPPAPPERRGEDPSPFVFIDVWVLAGVALLAAGAVFVRFVYNRLRRREEPAEDYWQDWNEPN